MYCFLFFSIRKVGIDRLQAALVTETYLAMTVKSCWQWTLYMVRKVLSLSAGTLWGRWKSCREKSVSLKTGTSRKDLP